jgi:hypothetical protein
MVRAPLIPPIPQAPVASILAKAANHILESKSPKAGPELRPDPWRQILSTKALSTRSIFLQTEITGRPAQSRIEMNGYAVLDFASSGLLAPLFPIKRKMEV